MVRKFVLVLCAGATVGVLHVVLVVVVIPMGISDVVVR